MFGYNIMVYHSKSLFMLYSILYPIFHIFLLGDQIKFCKNKIMCKWSYPFFPSSFFDNPIKSWRLLLIFIFCNLGKVYMLLYLGKFYSNLRSTFK